MSSTPTDVYKRLAPDLNQAWVNTAMVVLNRGDRVTCRGTAVDVSSLEHESDSFRLVDPRRNVLTVVGRRADPRYACAELLWYLSGANGIAMLQAYAPQYVKFAEDDGHAHGAYGHRMMMSEDVTQLDRVVYLLNNAPDSRQAVISVYDTQDLAHALAGDRRDIPCTLSMQLLLRKGELNAVVTMRSNDVWLGLPYDVFCFTCIQQIIADRLDVRVGWYDHQVGSMHIYARDVDRARSAAYNHRQGVDSMGLTHGWSKTRDFSRAVDLSLEIEGLARYDRLSPDSKQLVALDIASPMLYDITMCAASKWVTWAKPSSPLLLRAMQVKDDVREIA